MEYNGINYLVDEHDVIAFVEELLPLCEEFWLKDADAYAECIKVLLTFFREYSDMYHHKKEEEILFPKLKKHPEFAAHEMLDELEEHHEQFRTYLSEIEQSLEQENYVNTYKLLKDYVNELLDHIAAENDELFVLAETLFSPTELENMYHAFKDLDMELGEEEKKKLVGLINKVEQLLSQSNH